MLGLYESKAAIGWKWNWLSSMLSKLQKLWILSFSSPEPFAHGELLWSLDVRRQQLLQRTPPPKLLAGCWPNLVGMILIWHS